MTRPYDYALQAAVGKPRKYRNEPTLVDGIRFASKKEARRYGELKLLQKAEEIGGLTPHPRYMLRSESGAPICIYVADFDYLDFSKNATVTEDVKSPITRKNPVYRLKKRWFEADYKREIVEI